MRVRPKLTYANVVATLALFFAMTGGAVYAADSFKVKSRQIAARAVKSGKIAPKAVKRGKIAPGAVGSDQLAGGAVTRGKIGSGAVGTTEIEDGSIGRADLAEPVGFVADATGGSASLVDVQGEPYALSGGSWVAAAGEFDVIFGQVKATLQATEGNQCNVELRLYANGREAGGAWMQSGSGTPEEVVTGVAGEPRINFEAATPQTLTAKLTSYNCAAGSQIAQTRIRVLGIG